MFTVKFYSHQNQRSQIYCADSVCIDKAEDSSSASVFLYDKDGLTINSFSVGGEPRVANQEIYGSVIVENANGRTTEIFRPRLKGSAGNCGAST
jgi:hypothetical protein